MKNKIKKQEIFNLIKKALSLSLVALFATVNLTSCNFFLGSTNKQEYIETDFGDLVDPTAPLTQEQIEKAKKSKDFLESFEYDFKENGIKTIQIRKPQNPRPESSYFVEISQDTSLLDGINVKISNEACEKLIKLSDNCSKNKFDEIEKIEYEEVDRAEEKHLHITITFNEKNGEILQKYLSIIQPFVPTPNDTYLENVDTISNENKKKLFEFLCQKNEDFKHGIARIEPTANTNENSYFIKIKNIFGYESYIVPVSEDQYNRFNKYLEFENLYTDKTNTDKNGNNLQIKSFYLLQNHAISDTLKEQIYNEIYKILEENNIFDVQ